MKISIVTATYNSKKTVKETINSILSQSYDDWELIIQDGGSTDGTIELIKKSFSDKRINIFQSSDEGIYDAMNKGWKNSTGDVIGILNSDDIFYDDSVLKDIADTFKSNIQICYGNILMTDSENLNKIKRKWISKEYQKGLMLLGWMPPHPSFYCTRNIFTQVNGFNTSYKGGSDYDFMLKALENDLNKSFFLNKYFVKMRYGGESTKSIKNIIKFNLECLFSRNNYKKRYKYLLDLAFFYKPFIKIKQFFY